MPADVETSMTRFPRSRHLALVSAVLLVGLSACGASDDDAAGPPAPGVIQIAGAAGGASGASLDAAIPAESSTGSSKMMAAYLEYVYSGEAADLTEPAASWFFPAGTSPTTAQVEAVAAALGVSGTVRELGVDMGGGWAVGSQDYSGASVTVSPDAMQSWWFNVGAAATSVGFPDCEYFPPGDPAGGATDATAPLCAEPTPPFGVPTADEAMAKALALFESMGIAVDSYDFETYADEWSANVTGYLTLEGVRTTVAISAGFGAEGALTWANGFLAAPERGADYPRIGVAAAVERLNEQQSMMYPMTRGGTAVGYAEAGVATADIAVAPAAPGAEVSTTDPAGDPATDPATEPATEPAIDPATDPATEPATEPPVCGPATDCAIVPIGSVPTEPITVTLANAQPSLEQVWAADNTVWLLPGYRFDVADGGLASVIAIADEYLAYTDPAPLPEPLPAPLPEPVPGGSVPPEPAVTTLPAPVACGDAVAPEAVVDGTELIGRCLTDVEDIAASLGIEVRVVRLDGVDLAATDDYRENRFNVAVVNGVITEILSLG